MAKRQRDDWYYAHPDRRNELLNEARELVASAEVMFKRLSSGRKKYAPEWSKAAASFMKETRP